MRGALLNHEVGASSDRLTYILYVRRLLLAFAGLPVKPTRRSLLASVVQSWLRGVKSSCDMAESLST